MTPLSIKEEEGLERDIVQKKAAFSLKMMPEHTAINSLCFD